MQLREQNKCRIAYVYELLDPRNGSVRYVGCSIKPYIRLHQHKLARFNGGCFRNMWIRELTDEGLEPEIRICFIVPYSTRFSYEYDVINAYKDSGVELTNAVGVISVSNIFIWPKYISNIKI